MIEVVEYYTAYEIMSFRGIVHFVMEDLFADRPVEGEHLVKHSTSSVDTAAW